LGDERRRGVYKLLRNGFLPDEESGGHGALFVLEDPVRALLATVSFISRASYLEGWRAKGEAQNDRGK
jgi:hypothetical protein